MAAPAWTRPGILRAWLLGTTALLPAAGGALAQGLAPNALPTGGQVSAGAASIAQSGSTLQVTQSSNRAAINWQGFSVGANARVNFQQPGAGAWTLNRVTGADPSVIAGRITANGGVAIVNQSGVVFAAGAQVNVGSLIASAATITNENFMAGRLVFDGPPRPGATVENHGSITIADRGLAALVGPRVANSGSIRARLGRVALAGAETFSIDLAGDGLLSIDVTQAVRPAAGGGAALVTNSGVIEAQGGSVLLSAHAASGLVEDLVRNTGSIAANAAAGRSGQVALRAEGGGVRVEGSIGATGRGRQAGGSIAVRGSTSTTIAATARLDASGGAGGGRVLVGTTGVGRDQAMSVTTTVARGARISADARRRGNGGTVAVNSTGSTVVEGSVSARGGRQGGHGGLIELSGQDRLALQAQVDLSAPKGKAGTLLLDPQNITVVAALPVDPVADGGAGSATTTPAPGVTTVSAAAGTGTTFVTAASLNVLDGAGITVQLEAKQTIAVNAALGLANSTLNLFADGAVTQTATITAGTLVIRGFAGGSTAAGSATLNLANTIGTLDAIATGVLSVNNGTTGLMVANARGSAVTLTTTGTLGLAGAVGGSGATVILKADGTINQTGGSITAASLTVSDNTGAGATAGTVNLGRTNAVNEVDVRATGAVTINNGGNALLLSRATGSSIAVIAGALTVPGGATVQAPGGILSLRVDTLAWGGLLDAGTTGTLEIGPRSNASPVSLGAGGAAALQVDPGNFDATRLIAGTFTLGETTIGASMVRGNGLTVTGAVAPDAAAVATALRLVADVGTAISVAAPIDMAGRAVALRGSGAIGQAAAGRITAATLDVAAPGGGAAGAVTLNAVANAIGRVGIASSSTVLLRNDATPLTLGGLSGTGATITTAGTLTIDGAISLGAGTLNLFSDGAIGQTGGVVTAGSVVVRNAAGALATTQSVALDGADNAIAAIDIATSAGVAVRNGATDLAVTALSASGATLTTGGALAFGGVANLGAGTLTLRAGGAVIQTNAAVVTAGSLTLRGPGGVAAAGGALDFGTTEHAIGALDAKSTTAITLRNGATDLLVNQAVAPTVLLQGRGALSIAGLVDATGGTGITLQLDGAVTATGAASLRGPNLSVFGLIGADAAGIDLAPGSHVLAAYAGQASGLNRLAQAGALSVLAATGSTVDIASTGGALALGGAVGGSGAAVTLSAQGDLTQPGGSITAATLSARSATGRVDLQRTNAVASASLAAATTLDFASAGALTVTGASGTIVTLAAPSLSLTGAVAATTSLALTTAAGDISQAAAGVITTPRLAAIASGGAVLLDIADDLATGNSIGQLGASSSSGGIGVASRTAMEVHAAGIGVTAAAGATIALKAPSLAINQALGFAAADAGNRVSLTADALSATASINAGATGQVTIRPRAASRGIDLGGTTANTLQLGAATLGQVTAGRLLISAAGATGIGLNADVVLGGVGILELVAGNGIAQDHATGLTVAGLAATAAAGSIDLGGANQIGAIAGTLADAATGLSATGGIALATAGALSVGARVQAGNARTIAITTSDLTSSAGIATTGSSAANRIDLRADTVVLGADVTATGGVVNILPRTGGRAVRLGGADGVLADTLTLPTSQFRFIQAGSGMLRIGGTDTATSAGTITLGGEVPLRASVSGGAVIGGSAATLDLRGSAVATDLGLVFGLNVANLTGTTGSGFVLDQPGNAIGTLGAIAGNTVTVFSDLALTANGPVDGGAGRVVLDSAGSLTLAGDILATTGVALGADGAILQTSGRIVAPVVEAGGFALGATDITLPRSGNDFGALTAAAGGAVQVFSTAATAGALSLSGPVTGASVAMTSDRNLDTGGGAVTATGGAIALTATGTITLGNSLAATGDITLLASLAAGTSAITQTAGSLRSSGSGRIGLTADSISLLVAANSVGTAGLVRLRPLIDGRAITLGATVANTLSLVSGAGIAAGRVLIGRSEAGPISLGGSFGVGAATLELITNGAIAQAGGTVLTAGALSATAGGAIILDGQNLIDAVAGSTADPTKGLSSGGSIALTTARAGGLTTGAAIAAANGASITLRADALALGGTAGASSGSLAALNILPNTAGTAVTLGADAAGLALGGDEIGFLRAGTGTLRIGGDGSGVTAGAITLAGDALLRGGTAPAAVLDLRGDSVAQTGGRVAVATLTGASTAGGFALDRLAAGAPVNQIDSLGLGGTANPMAVSATSGSVAIASATALLVRGNVTAAAGSGSAGVSLRGNGLTIGDDTALAKTVLLQAGRGDLALDAGTGMLTTSAVTTLRAQDPASLAAEGTGADLSGTILLSGGTVTLAGTLDASRASGGRDILLTGTAALELGDVSLAARRDLGLASTAGGITVQAAAALVAGRDLGLTGLSAMPVAGTLTANRSIGLTSTGGTVSLTGTATAAASGPVLAEAGAGLTISGLGNVALDGNLTATGRSILATTTTGTLTVGGTLSTANGGSITLNAGGTDGRVRVTAPGAVSGGTVALHATRQIETLGSIAGSDITLTVGPSASPFSPAFEAGSGGSLIASGALAITANSGNIGLTAATLQAGSTLALTAAAGSITQTQGSTSAGGAVTLQAATGITVTAAGGTLPVLRSTSAALSVATSGGDIALTEASIGAGTTLGLTALTSALTQSGGSLTAGTTLNLASGGNTTQLAGGRIIAPVLTGVAGGTVTLLNGATLPGALVAEASGNGIGAIAGYMAGGDLSLASNATPLGITGLVSAGAGRALRLFADDYALTAGLAAPGGSVTLSPYTRNGSIALVLGGPAGAGAGSTITLDSAELALLPPGGIGTLRFGTADNPSGLTDLASVTIAGAADLGTRVSLLALDTRGAISQNAGSSLTVPLLTATAGDSISFDPGSSANRIGGLAGIRTPGSFSLRSALAGGAALTIGAGSFAEGIRAGSGRSITLRADDLDIGAAVRAPGGGITLMADTARRGITLGGAGAATLSLSAAELQLLGGEGGGGLAGGAATLLRIDATTVPGNIAIAGTVDLQGPAARVQALELLSAGNVAGSGGAITVPVLRATVAGDLVLDNAGNGFLLNRITAANATIRQAGDLRLANAVAALGGVDAPGGIAATGTVRLIAGGGLTQENGATIAAGTLALAAGTTVTLEEANAFATLAGVSILGGGPSRVRGAHYTVAGPVGVTGGLTLLADTGLGATGSIATGGALALLTTLGDIVLDGASLTVGGGLTMAAGSGPASGGNISVTGGSIGATGAAVLTATRDATLANPGDIGLNGTTIIASTDLTLAAGGGITAGSSTVTATTGALAATAKTGSIGLTGTTAGGGTAATLAAATGLTVTGGGVAAAGGALTASTTTGDLALDGASLTATGTLDLLATAGAIRQRRGTTGGGGNVTLQAFGGIAVTADGGASPILRSTGGSLGILAEAGNVTLANARLDAASGIGIAAGGGIGATDSRLATAGGTLSLAATAGDLILLRGTLASTAGDLDLTAGGAGSLTATSLAAPSASGRVRVVTGGPLTLRGLTVTADVADFEAGRLFPTIPAAYGQTRPGGLLLNDGITASIGTKLLFAGPSGITDLGLTMVLPRGAALPAVIYDTRLNPAANPLGQVLPDVAGLPATQQATQVRSAAGALSPGAFGLPDQSTAAGAVAMNLNAGQSAVFLLVDGGSIRGNIVAGRLGVQGSGGGMSVLGTLDGSPGAQAARFADITRPIAATELQRYRINGCVVSSVNCVVPPSIQLIPPRPGDRAAFRLENNRINTSEVLIPNIAEEDEE